MEQTSGKPGGGPIGLLCRRPSCGTLFVSQIYEFRGNSPVRQIGTLPKSLDPKLFADYLLGLGIKTRVDSQPEGWQLWIYNEDHFTRARDELQSYVSAPDSPRYRDAQQAAEAVRRKQEQIEREFRKNDRRVADLWAYPGFRRRPLTMALVAVCVVIFLLQQSNWGDSVEEKLFFVSYYQDAQGHIDDGLSGLRHGEIWRLVTPILMHGSILHIFFNMSWLTYLGTLIEIRRGALRLAGLVLISGILSNVGQYMWMERTDPGVPHYGLGFSGVIYALFGYIWMKGLYEPEQGMTVHPNTVNLMLLWLVLCMTGLLGPIGNAAHFVGLAVGVALGVLRF
jgi:GlpG protein